MLTLEDRILTRLEAEREGFVEGLSLLRSQRVALERAVADVAARRRDAAAATRAEIAAATEGLGCIRLRAALAADEEVTAFLGDALAFAVPQSETTAGSESSPAPWQDRPSGPGEGAGSRPFRAIEPGPPQPEGRWVLPMVRTMAKLRRAFEEVASIRARSEALELALRRLEAGLIARLDRLRACAERPDGGSPPGGAQATAEAGDAGARAPAPRHVEWAHRPRSGSPMPEEVAAAEAAGRMEACGRGVADLDHVLAALDGGRPAECRRAGASAVCRPPHVEIWVGSELDALDPSDPADLPRLHQILDEFLGPGGLAGP